MLENQERHRAQLMRSLERMRTYAELRDCRRRYLLDYFGQEIEPCGRCDNCERGLPESLGDADERPFPVRTRVVHQKLGKGVVLDYSGSHLTILFDEAGEKALDVKFALEHGLLARA